MKNISKLLVIISIFLVPVIVFATMNIDFDSRLSSEFPNYTGNQSNIHFMYGGNDFEGVIFPTTGITITTGVDISFSGNMIYDCKKQIEGLYYNNNRGLLIWPLDLHSLSGLKNIDTGYDSLDLTGGLFYDCSGINTNEVYGQVTINLSGLIYKLIGGGSYDFTNNLYLDNFNNSLVLSGEILSGYIYDNYGGIGKVYKPPFVVLSGYMNFVTGINLKKINDIFYTNKTGITLEINTNKPAYYKITGDNTVDITGTIDSYNLISIEITNSDGNKVLNFRLDSILDDGFVTGVNNITLDTAPSEASPLMPVDQSLVNDNVNFSRNSLVDTGIGIANYELVVLSGSSLINDVLFDNTTFHYNMFVYPEGTPGNVLISGGNYTRYMKSIDEFGNATISNLRHFQAGYTSSIDIFPPTKPVIISPKNYDLHNESMINFSWNASVDSGVGLDDYKYYIYSTVSGFMLFGATNSISASISNSVFNTGDYYRYVDAYDLSGNMNRSNIEYFHTTPALDVIPDTFSFEKIDDAKRNKAYKSNTVIVGGLANGVEALVETNRGALFIDGEFVGLSGMVSNGSGVQIELISSSEYDTTRSATITIGTKSSTFYIETERYNHESSYDDNTNDSDFLEHLFAISPKIEVIRTFNHLKEIYADESLSKQKDFFYTFWSNLKDEIFTTEYKIKIETDNDEKVELEKQLYLLDTFNSLVLSHLMHVLGYSHELLNDEVDRDGKYIAPNNKVYYISVRSSDGALYSDTFKTKKYFPTREIMKKYIDDNNPAIMHNASGEDYVITPNGKTYRIVFDTKTMTYYSPDSISQKHFESVIDLHVRLDINNPGEGYRDHTVDPSFPEIEYKAPNNKLYIIKKTTDNRFYSPMFTSAKYFPDLDSITAHIDVHNIK